MSTSSKFIVCAIAIIAVFLFWKPLGSDSVDAYRQRMIAEVNQELLKKENPVRQRIESAHVTVTVKSAKVSSCIVTTIDGTDKAGRNGSNVREVTLDITTYWDGWLHKDGYTEFRIVYDPQSRKAKETKFLKSNAMLNLETVDWYSVGFAFGTFLATL